MFLLEQMTAGAVTLTDVVYWCMIFPFVVLRDYEYNFVSAYSGTFSFMHLFLFYPFQEFRHSFHALSTISSNFRYDIFNIKKYDCFFC